MAPRRVPMVRPMKLPTSAGKKPHMNTGDIPSPTHIDKYSGKFSIPTLPGYSNINSEPKSPFAHSKGSGFTGSDIANPFGHTPSAPRGDNSMSPQQALRYAEAIKKAKEGGSHGGFSGLIHDGGSLLGDALGIIARPNHAIAQGVSNALDHKSVVAGVKAGLSGDSHESFGDVLKEHHILDHHKWVRAAAGLGLDVVTDPTSYIGGIGLYGDAARLGAHVGLDALTKGGAAHIAEELGSKATLHEAEHTALAHAREALFHQDETTKLALEAAHEAAIGSGKKAEAARIMANIQGREARQSVLDEVAHASYKASQVKKLGLRYGIGKYSVTAHTPFKIGGTLAERIATADKVFKYSPRGLYFATRKAMSPGFMDPVAHALEMGSRHVGEQVREGIWKRAQEILKPVAKTMDKKDMQEALFAGETKGVVKDGQIVPEKLADALEAHGIVGIDRVEKATMFLKAWHDVMQHTQMVEKAFGVDYKKGAIEDHIYVPHMFDKEDPYASMFNRPNILSRMGHEKYGQKLTYQRQVEAHKNGEMAGKVSDDPLEMLVRRIGKAGMAAGHATLREALLGHGVASHIIRPDALTKMQKRLVKLAAMRATVGERLDQIPKDHDAQMDALHQAEGAEHDSLVQHTAKQEAIQRKLDAFERGTLTHGPVRGGPLRQGDDLLVHGGWDPSLSGLDFQHVPDQVREAFHETWDRLDPEVRDAVDEYTHDSKALNQALRSTGGDPSLFEKNMERHVVANQAIRDEAFAKYPHPEDSMERQIHITMRRDELGVPRVNSGDAENHARMVEAIDRGIEESAPLEHPIQVFRGMRDFHIPFDQVNPGDRLIDPAFASTSSRRDAAEVWAGVEGSIAHDSVEEGAYWDPEALDGYLGDVKQSIVFRIRVAQGTKVLGHTESPLDEIILPRGSMMIVRKKTMGKDGVLRIEADHIPPDMAEVAHLDRQTGKATLMKQMHAINRRLDDLSGADSHEIAAAYDNLREQAAHVNAQQLQLVHQHDMGLKEQMEKIGDRSGERVFMRNPSVKAARAQGYVEAPSLTRFEHGREVSYYVPKEIAQSVRRASEALGDPTKMTDLQRHIDRALHAWKLGVTSINPGYRIRNTLSDAWNMYLSGMPAVAIPIYARKATKLMNAAKNGDVKAQRMLLQAQYRGVLSGLFAGDVAKDVKYGLRGNRKNAASFLADKALQGNTWAENAGRLTHYLWRLDQGHSTTSAAREIRMAHFDYEDLTDTERKVFKRIVPFYTWTRKDVPYQLQQLLSAPGRVATYGKVVQESELASGKKKGEVIGNALDYHPLAFKTPFGYVDPGIGLNDLTKVPGLGTSLSGSAKQAVGMMNPLLKGAVELGANRNLETGQAIHGKDAYYQSTPAPGFLADILKPFGLAGETQRSDGKKEVHGPGINNVVAYLMSQTPITGAILNQNKIALAQHRGKSIGPLNARFGSELLGSQLITPNAAQQLQNAVMQENTDSEGMIRELRAQGLLPESKRHKKSPFEKAMERLIREQISTR